MEDNNIVYSLIGKDYNYDVIEPSDNKKGHGSNLSVKIVIPSYCQAKCPFCFNKLTVSTQKHNYGEFLDNLDKSLDMITDNIDKRGITLDITGNEPTFNIFLFMKLMNQIKLYKEKVSRVILTTNGFRIYDCIDYMEDVVDIVNISLHHYNYDKRKKIFGTSSIPNDVELRNIVKKLKEKNITATAVCVLYEDIGNFNNFYDKFTNYAKDLGFKDVRLRSNFCENDSFIDDYLEAVFPNQSMNELGGLTTKIITDNSGFETRILKGVPDLTEYVIGAELVIDDNGKCYIDYNKRYPVDNNNIKYFNNFYILGNKKKVLAKKLVK